MSKPDRSLIYEATHASCQEYARLRKEALSSLDEDAIRAWLRRYGMVWLTAGFWTRVHRLRASPWVGCSEQEREESRRWLQARGVVLPPFERPAACKPRKHKSRDYRGRRR
jgi:hypothetical protein